MATADERVPQLLSTLGPGMRFISYEPMLGPLDLRENWTKYPQQRINWVIAGGESGPQARSNDLAWPRIVRDQCAAAGVSFFMKQLGAKPHEALVRLRVSDMHGGDMSEWPEDLRVREWPMSA